MNNNVNHPDHYQSKKGIEVIDVMEAFTEGLTGITAVDTAMVIKYILRWNKKNGLEDLEKAKWYIDHLIAHVSTVNKKAYIAPTPIINDPPYPIPVHVPKGE